jgi:hypothetical protein
MSPDNQIGTRRARGVPACAGVKGKGELVKHHFKTECPRCGKVDEMTCEGDAF